MDLFRRIAVAAFFMVFPDERLDVLLEHIPLSRRLGLSPKFDSPWFHVHAELDVFFPWFEKA